MAVYEFDSLVSSARCIFESSRKSIELKQKAMLERLFEEQDNGKTQAVTWIFKIPSKEDARGYQELKLPLLSLRSTSQFRISEFSIEFDGEIEEVSEKTQTKLSEESTSLNSTGSDDAENRPIPKNGKQKISPVQRLIMWVKKYSSKPQKNLERVKITYQDQGSPGGEIYINGQLLKTVEVSDKA